MRLCHTIAARAAILLALFALCLPASAQEIFEVDGKELVPATPEERAQAFFLEGVRQRLKGNYSEAYDLFNHTVEINPNHVGAQFERASFANALRDDSLTMQLMEQTAALDPENYYVKQALVTFYLNNNQPEKAISVLEDMAQRYPRKSEVLLMLVEIYGQQGNYAQVVKALDRVELLEGKSEELSMQKFRTYVKMGETKRAFAEMEALAEEYPNDPRYRVLIGDLYLDNEQPEKAKAIYDQVLREYPNNVNAMMSLASYYEQTGQQELTTQTVSQLLVHEQVSAEVRENFLTELCYQNYRQDGDTAAVLPLFRQVLSMPQENTNLANLCAQYMVSKNVPKEQVKPVLEQILSIDPEHEDARSQLLIYAIQDEDSAEIARLCKTAVDYGSDEGVFYYYHGLLLYQQGQLQEAADVLGRGVKKANSIKQTDLKASMFTLRGDILHQLGNDRLAFEQYDSCLLLKPADAYTLNNYAYYLSLLKKDLTRAEQMSKLSMEKDPDNYNHIDTYAWILFQQKRYEEAREAQSRVMELLGDSLLPEHAGVVEHTGDIEAKCGNIDAAMRYWQQAKELFQQLPDDDADKPTDLQRVAQKLRKKKYVEP